VIVVMVLHQLSSIFGLNLTDTESACRIVAVGRFDTIDVLKTRRAQKISAATLENQYAAR
jgi:hypothetical protein